MCIDLMLTNRPNSFQNTLVIETALSNFHKMTVTLLKTCTKKEAPKIISYRAYKHFSNELFQAELNLLVSFQDINNITYDKFDEIIMFLVNKHVPLKYKYIRANQGPFMNKTLKKAIISCSKLKKPVT